MLEMLERLHWTKEENYLAAKLEMLAVQEMRAFAIVEVGEGEPVLVAVVLLS